MYQGSLFAEAQQFFQQPSGFFFFTFYDPTLGKGSLRGLSWVFCVLVQVGSCRWAPPKSLLSQGQGRKLPCTGDCSSSPGSPARCTPVPGGREGFALQPLGRAKCGFFQEARNGKICWVLQLCSFSSSWGYAWLGVAGSIGEAVKLTRNSPSLFPGSSLSDNHWAMNKQGSYIFLFVDVTLCSTSTKIPNHMVLFLWLYLFCTTAR